MAGSRVSVLMYINAISTIMPKATGLKRPASMGNICTAWRLRLGIEEACPCRESCPQITPRRGQRRI